MAVPQVQTTFQVRTVGEEHQWRILTRKMRVLVLDQQLKAMVLVARAVLVNERMFMHEF